MQSLPKGVELYIHRLIHESFTKEIVKEYNNLYFCDYNYFDGLFSSINSDCFLNYRPLFYYNKDYAHIHNISISIDYYDTEPLPDLPKCYIYTSGLNSGEGYKND